MNPEQTYETERLQRRLEIGSGELLQMARQVYATDQSSCELVAVDFLTEGQAAALIKMLEEIERSRHRVPEELAELIGAR